MPPSQMYFQLPAAYRPEGTRQLLSANAQIYVVCKACSWEDRANPMYLRPPESLLAEPCRRCGSTTRAVIRHMEQVEGKCLDCGHDLADTVTAPWTDLTCAACGSHRLEVSAMTISPPFPALFGELGDSPNASTDPTIGMGKEAPWGVDPMQDGQHINREVRWAVQMFPDSHLHVLCETLFCRTLCENGEYAQRHEFCWLVSLQGQLLRDYFRTTGDIAAAIRGLTLEEQAVSMAPDCDIRAAIEHNCAIAINSMLAQYDEEVVAAATGRPQIRAEGIAAARRALEVYQAEAADSPSARQQVGRTHHLIGDLLRAGNVDQAQIRAALQEFAEALRSDLPPSLAIGVAQSRGEAIANLDDPTREQLLQAERDLIAAISADTKRIARSFQWLRFFQLATVARKLGATDRELTALEQGAALALEQIRHNPEEWILQQRSERMTVLFDELARVYAEAGRPVDALGAAETLRAATLRLHTMRAAESERLNKERLASVGRDLLPEAVRHLFPDSPEEPATDDSIGTVALGLLDYLKDVPTACISYLQIPGTKDQAAKIVAFVCGPSGAEEPGIEIATLPGGATAVEWSPELIEPGPLRENALTRMHIAAYKAYFEPLEAVLGRLKVTRVILSLPSLLTRFAFEALTNGPKKSAGFLLDNLEVAYLPSFALGFDLARLSQPERSGRLLVVGYQGDDLTYAAGEVEALRKLFGDRMKLLSGPDCNKTTVMHELGLPYDYIHFVSHGTYDYESPLNAALHFVSDVEDDSQRLTAGDIMANVKLPANPAITMSACSTALMSSSPTNNCHGLTGSLLRAGARCVIGSRWPVYDETAASFMTQFYEKVASGKPSADLLRYVTEVQRTMRVDQGIEDFAAFGYMGIPVR
jgi:hypothetical protein